LMRIIAVLQAQKFGTIRFGDVDVLTKTETLRRTLGHLPHDFGVFPRVSAYQILDHMAVPVFWTLVAIFFLLVFGFFGGVLIAILAPPPPPPRQRPVGPRLPQIASGSAALSGLAGHAG
jgi:hypothetical protein